MARFEYKIKDLLTELPENKIGKNLEYTQIYDEIKKARYEEDARLSQGVWEREPIKANWPIVEAISVNALQTQSKDLQIVAWLIESLVVLDGFYGIVTGIELLCEFISHFWEICYPLLNDNYSDFEQKERIIDWLDDAVCKKITLISMFQENGFSLYDYEYAVKLKSQLLQFPDKSQELQQEETKTLDQIDHIISSKESPTIHKLQIILQTIKDKIIILKQTLNSKSSNINPFVKVNGAIGKIQQILKNHYANIEEIEENNNNAKNDHILQQQNLRNIKDAEMTRDEIYDKLTNLANSIELIDKHSPSPYLLKLVVSWKNKDLLGIIDDLHNGDTNAHKLLKILLE